MTFAASLGRRPPTSISLLGNPAEQTAVPPSISFDATSGNGPHPPMICGDVARQTAPLPGIT